MRNIRFQCENKKSAWTGTIQITEENENSIIGKVEARDSQFLIALSRYYHGYGMEEWCICVPNWNFGCKIARTDQRWNMEQFRPHVKNPIDRASLAQAVEVILADREEKAQKSEDKETICKLLLKTLQQTRSGEDLILLEYDPEKETVTGRFRSGGIRNCNVEADSGLSMIRDIIKQLEL